MKPLLLLKLLLVVGSIYQASLSLLLSPHQWLEGHIAIGVGGIGLVAITALLMIKSGSSSILLLTALAILVGVQVLIGASLLTEASRELKLLHGILAVIILLVAPQVILDEFR